MLSNCLPNLSRLCNPTRDCESTGVRVAPQGVEPPKGGWDLHVPWEEKYDEEREETIKQRRIQLDIVKKFKWYIRYTDTVPKYQRMPQLASTAHPVTPDLRGNKKKFERDMKQWRSQLKFYWKIPEDDTETPDSSVDSEQEGTEFYLPTWWPAGTGKASTQPLF